MAKLVSIGDFSRMTQLSVKTLRHYHDVGLLAPHRVDDTTGYRYYTAEQVPTAQVVRRLRELSMPIADVRAVLVAPPEQRNTLITAHLSRLEEQLAATRNAVESLRALLEQPGAATGIEYRSEPATASAAITTVVDRDELVPWWEGAVAELRAAAAAGVFPAAGGIGALFDFDIFANDRGSATLFIPSAGEFRAHGRIRPLVIPAADLVVSRFHGPHDNADLAYGKLGEYATGHEISVDGPLREYYRRYAWDTDDANSWVTDLCWPVFRAGA